jgi:hypothetical protein
MTLKEKFKKQLDTATPTLNRPIYQAEQCKEIADEFAIGFAEWIIQWRVEFVDDTRQGVLYTYGGLYLKFKMKELLEIYKKEKGL